MRKRLVSSIQTRRGQRHTIRRPRWPCENTLFPRSKRAGVKDTLSGGGLFIPKRASRKTSKTRSRFGREILDVFSMFHLLGFHQLRTEISTPKKTSRRCSRPSWASPGVVRKHLISSMKTYRSCELGTDREFRVSNRVRIESFVLQCGYTSRVSCLK